MIDGIPSEALPPSVLLGIGILLVLTGRLVPRRTLEDVSHDRDEWRAAHRISEAARAEDSAQTQELLEQARTTNALLHSLWGLKQERSEERSP